MSAKPELMGASKQPHALPLAGRHAVITGGGTGIGAAIAEALADAGAEVRLMGRRRHPLEATRQRLTPARHAIATVDVTDEAAVKSAFAEAGAIDILVNNAGAAESAPFAKTSLALFQRMLAVNTTGAFLCTQAALPGMLARGRGRIVNIASTAGITGYRYVSAYVASKHALVGLTRALALELATSGVTVNAVCPGFTDTDIVANAVAKIAETTKRSPDAARAELARANPMGRLVRPEEVAHAVLFLCQDAAAAITGQAIVVAGGEVMP